MFHQRSALGLVLAILTGCGSAPDGPGVDELIGMVLAALVDD